MGKKLSGKDLIKLGCPQTNSVNITLGQINRYRKKETKQRNLDAAKLVLVNPEEYRGDPIWGKVAEALIQPVEVKMHQLRTERVPFTIFGEDEIEDNEHNELNYNSSNSHKQSSKNLKG